MPTYAAVAGAVIGALLVGGGVLWFAGLPKENASAGQLNTRLSAIETQIRETGATAAASGGQQAGRGVVAAYRQA